MSSCVYACACECVWFNGSFCQTDLWLSSTVAPTKLLSPRTLCTHFLCVCVNVKERERQRQSKRRESQLLKGAIITSPCHFEHTNTQTKSCFSVLTIYHMFFWGRMGENLDQHISYFILLLHQTSETLVSIFCQFVLNFFVYLTNSPLNFSPYFSL